jgi:hypothetical protein
VKEGLVGRFIRGGVPENSQQSVENLVVAAVSREYRCKDWMYAPLARSVDGPSLRHRLAGSAVSQGPLTRLRSKFVLHVLNDPGLHVKRATWQRWLATDRESIS